MLVPLHTQSNECGELVKRLLEKECLKKEVVITDTAVEMGTVYGQNVLSFTFPCKEIMIE